MLKIQAIKLLGGAMPDAAVAMGISYQAVNKWPDLLPDRIADRVLGTCVRRGIPIPAEFTDKRHLAGAAVQADAPLTADPALNAELAKAERAGLVVLPKKQPTWDGVERRVAQLPRRAADLHSSDIATAGQGA